MERTAAILVGGLSRRFGSDKTALTLGAESVVQHLAATLTGIGCHVVLLGPPRPHLIATGLPIVEDTTPGAGPLHALRDALTALPAARLLLTAADMPWLVPAVAEQLWQTNASAAITHLEGSPLPGVYARTLLPAIDAVIHAGRHSLYALLDHCRADVTTIPHAAWISHDAAARSLANINTPEEWASLSAG